MPKKERRLLRIGVLGAGQIAQAAHFESCAGHLRRRRGSARTHGDRA